MGCISIRKPLWGRVLVEDMWASLFSLLALWCLLGQSSRGRKKSMAGFGYFLREKPYLQNIYPCDVQKDYCKSVFMQISISQWLPVVFWLWRQPNIDSNPGTSTCKLCNVKTVAIPFWTPCLKWGPLYLPFNLSADWVIIYVQSWCGAQHVVSHLINGKRWTLWWHSLSL